MRGHSYINAQAHGQLHLSLRAMQPVHPLAACHGQRHMYIQCPNLIGKPATAAPDPTPSAESIIH